MPLHASALLALRRKPPPDATVIELSRDALLRSLTFWVYKYIAMAWVRLPRPSQPAPALTPS